MKPNIPAAAEVRARLEALSHAQMQVLARESGVPFTTLWKVRSGDTTDPRIDTVRKLYTALPLLKAKAA